MNPKTQLSGLDPKLKEAYERVMGTTIPLASPQPSGGGPAPTPAAPPSTPQEPSASAPTSQTEPLPPANQPSEPAPPAGGPAPAQPPPPVAPPQPPQPPEPAAPPLQEPKLPPIPPPQPPVAQNEPTGFVANAAKKGKLGGLKISPPILMAVGVAFLVLYIFFWMRVFNLSLF